MSKNQQGLDFYLGELVTANGESEETKEYENKVGELLLEHRRECLKEATKNAKEKIESVSYLGVHRALSLDLLLKNLDKLKNSEWAEKKKFYLTLSKIFSAKHSSNTEPQDPSQSR